MPYLKRSPSKYRWLPGWLNRQAQDVVDREKAKERGEEFVLPDNWGVPKGRELQ